MLGATWDMTRDAEMAARDFVRFVLGSLPGETDSTLLRVLVGQAVTATRLYTAPEHRAEAAALLSPSLRRPRRRRRPGSDAQFQLVEAWANSDHATLVGADRLRALLSGDDALDGLDIDTELRWTLSRRWPLSVRRPGGADAELDRDQTSTGHGAAAEALAARPTAEAKSRPGAQRWSRTRCPTRWSRPSAPASVAARTWRCSSPTSSSYHAMLVDAWAQRSVAMGERVVGGFYPFSLASPSLKAASDAWLAAHQDAAPGLVRTVAENRDGVVARPARAGARPQG